MNSKKFNKMFLELVNEYGFERVESYQGLEFQYSIDTVFGTLKVIASPLPKLKVYTVFMRFENLKRRHFINLMEETISRNGKWNIHVNDPIHALDLLEERLDNISHFNWINVFEGLALYSESVSDFMESVRQFKNVPNSVSDWFYRTYGRDGSASTLEASRAFIKETKEINELL